MRRYITIIILFTALHITGWAMERGVPFFMNFTATDYDAHNRNYDVACDNYGTVFVANFEGLIYYDGATWRKIYTPGISRVTCLAKGPKGKIWLGGYNVFGYLVSDKQGRLKMKLLMTDENNKGQTEFKLIKISGYTVYALTTKGQVYYVKNDESLELLKHGGDKIFRQAVDSVNSFRLPDMVRVSFSSDWGLRFDMPDKSITRLSETDGLASNNISYVTFDNSHTLWGATAKGIFCAEVTTPYSKLTDSEGLKGEVYCINEIGNTLYIGTLKGLFILRDGRLIDVKEIDQACWDLVDDGHDNLIAPTSDGLYFISKTGMRKITRNSSLSAYIDKTTGDYIVGEMDGVFRVSQSGVRTKIASVEKVIYITTKNNHLLLQNIYGTTWQIPANTRSIVNAQCISKRQDPSTPKIYYIDPLERIWKTDATGTNLQVISNNKVDASLQSWIYPIKDEPLNAIHVCHDGNIIVGGDFGIIVIDAKAIMGLKIETTQKPYIRQIVAMGDSVIWGGYSESTMKPVTSCNNINLPASCHDVTVTFSTRTLSLISPTLYRYRINGGAWSAWSEDNEIEFNNLSWGKTVMEIQARDLYGRISEISSVTWTIAAPWYLKWWAIVFYIILLTYIITLFFKWRERKLEQDKMKLEGIVAERTSELSDTLDNLKRTQNDLVRMEKTATAGKLTQGLIDRILNPINYINNFSKLTSGLAKDLKEDIEDEKDNMSEDNYEDCEDILHMMNQNLSKIEEHGVNTTRTLRAMEAMLNNHVGTLVSHDICQLCRQVVEVTKGHLKEDIARCGITLMTDMPDKPVMANIDAESMNKVLLSLLSNSVYAITKKYEQTPYGNPEIRITVKQTDEHVNITIKDNGIGIEDTIKDKVFDPFFTTKPTGEAAGVGLYLVRETIHDHNGTIALNSTKGEFCEISITL